MRTVALILTDRCHRKCAYCYGAEKTSPDMTVEVARKAVEVLRRKDEPFVLAFFGGEPMLAASTMFDIAYYFRRNGVDCRYTITTGGAPGYDPKLAACRMTRLGFSATVSLDGPEDVHDHQRGMGDYRKTREFLYHLRNMGVPVTLRSTLDPQMWGMWGSVPLDRVLRHHAGVTDERTCPVAEVVLASGRVKAAFDPAPAIRRGVEWYVKYRSKGGRPFWRSFERYAAMGARELPPAPTPRCGGCRNLVAVDGNGDIWPCHRRPYKPVGSVTEGPSEEALKAWWEHVYAARVNCQKCKVWPWCRGGCPAEDKDGCVSESACKWHMALIEAVLSAKRKR